MLDFLEKWSKKKGMDLSDETKRLNHRAFMFIDDDHDGIVIGREIQPALRVAKDYSYLGAAAENLFGYF